MQDPQNITRLLQAWSEGDDHAFDELLPVVYDRLRELARVHLQNERCNHTLDTTGLVHEAYLELARINQVEWADRVHFMAMASRAIRRVLIDYARKRHALKRGGVMHRITLELEMLPSSYRYLDSMLDLDDALTRLEKVHTRAARVIEYRYFGGLTHAETAKVLGVSTATVKRDQRFAKAWLVRTLTGE